MKGWEKMKGWSLCWMSAGGVGGQHGEHAGERAGGDGWTAWREGRGIGWTAWKACGC